MARIVEFKSLFIDARLTACAHSCRYCLMGKKQVARVSPSRVHALLRRFLEWEARGEDELSVGYAVNYTDDFDDELLDLLDDLGKRYPRDYEPLKRMTLGGLPMRSDEELRAWLGVRRRYGCISAHASIAGTHATHDYWNGQQGNFDLLMRTLRVAGELGMALGARMFVTRSTLPSLAQLNDMLDALPQHPESWRYAVPYFYIGWGARFEDERIDEEVRDGLPDWLSRLLWSTAPEGQSRSEREWIRLIREGRQKAADKIPLSLTVTHKNIDVLEAQSCQEIVADLKRRTLAAYASIPPLEELADRYGDRKNTKIYPLQRCVEIKWLDQHLERHPSAFERALTHLQIG